MAGPTFLDLLCDDAVSNAVRIVLGGCQAHFTFDGSATRGAVVSEMHYKGRVGRVDCVFIGFPDDELPHGEGALARLGIGFTLDYFALRQLSSARLVIRG